ncbi:MAG: ApaG domain [Akkermansia sp.]|nr:ApaG domain [Akkermansia sp.]MBR2313532.1 ApaG domain [Akkermansia sp.]
MNTDTRTLPVNPALELRLIIAGVQALRHPRPVYQVVFRVVICNTGSQSIRLLGRKWTLRERSGNTRLVEADSVFNQHPVLTPGAVFTTSGYQEFDTPPVAISLRLFGTSELGTPFISEPLHFPRSSFQF